MTLAACWAVRSGTTRRFPFFSYEGLRLRQQAPAAIQPYLNVYPIANGPELGGGIPQFNAGYSNPSSLDATSIRIDHAFNSKVTLFGVITTRLRTSYSEPRFRRWGQS